MYLVRTSSVRARGEVEPVTRPIAVAVAVAVWADGCVIQRIAASASPMGRELESSQRKKRPLTWVLEYRDVGRWKPSRSLSIFGTLEACLAYFPVGSSGAGRLAPPPPLTPVPCSHGNCGEGDVRSQHAGCRATDGAPRGVRWNPTSDAESGWRCSTSRASSSCAPYGRPMSRTLRPKRWSTSWSTRSSGEVARRSAPDHREGAQGRPGRRVPLEARRPRMEARAEITPKGVFRHSAT